MKIKEKRVSGSPFSSERGVSLPGVLIHMDHTAHTCHSMKRPVFEDAIFLLNHPNTSYQLAPPGERRASDSSRLTICAS